MFKLFLIFFRMGLFTFGGGYAMVPIMEKELVEKASLLSGDDFLDYLSVAQSFPGPIAINLSLLLGYRLGRLPAALCCLLGVTLPSFLVILLLSTIYKTARESVLLGRFFSGVYPVIPALLLLSFLRLFPKLRGKPQQILLLVLTFAGVALFRLNPLYFIAGGVLIGLCSYSYHSISSSSK